MIKEFELQLENATPITLEEYNQLEETTFYLDREKVIPNIRYKYYSSGRRKRVGDIVLIAILAIFTKDKQAREGMALETIMLHPEEIDDYELCEIQPTVNKTFYPIVVLKSSRPKKIIAKIGSLISKLINNGFNSLTEEEKKTLKKNSEN